METLGKIFGSETKVKIMRLFLFNQEQAFDIGHMSTKVGEMSSKVRREVNILEKISFLKKRIKTETVKNKKISKKKKNKKISKKVSVSYVLNKDFGYLAPLQNFLVSGKPMPVADVVKRLNVLGNIKLIAVAGVFIRETDSRVDLLLVGDNIPKSKIEKVIKSMEADIGVELRFAYFSTQDFLYRLDLCDKLLRDIFDYPHQILVNKLAVLQSI